MYLRLCRVLRFLGLSGTRLYDVALERSYYAAVRNGLAVRS